MNVIDYGKWFEEAIRLIASLLASEGFAGIVCITLLLALITLMLIYSSGQRASIRVINTADDLISNIKNELEFADDLEALQALNEFSDENSKSFSHSFGRAWEEYYETLIIPTEEGEVYRNTIRPSYFFNSEDLGQTHPIWKQIPSIFVSVGLLLTFLGIISAIGGLIETSPQSQYVGYKGEQKIVYISIDNEKKIYAFKRNETDEEYYLVQPIPNRAAPETPIEFQQKNDKAPEVNQWKVYQPEVPTFNDQGMALFWTQQKLSSNVIN